MASSTQKQYSREEVAKHTTTKSLWVIVDSAVYDLTTFAGILQGLIFLSMFVVVAYDIVVGSGGVMLVFLYCYVCIGGGAAACSQ